MAKKPTQEYKLEEGQNGRFAITGHQKDYWVQGEDGEFTAPKTKARKAKSFKDRHATTKR